MSPIPRGLTAAAGERRHLDGSQIKLHQDGTSPRGGRARPAIGRTRGGINAKRAALVDGRACAVALGWAAGERPDLLAGAHAPRALALQAAALFAPHPLSGNAAEKETRSLRNLRRLSPTRCPSFQYLPFGPHHT